jgi:hypothetical protein
MFPLMHIFKFSWYCFNSFFLISRTFMLHILGHSAVYHSALCHSVDCCGTLKCESKMLGYYVSFDA